jgi:hypothetical protein
MPESSLPTRGKPLRPTLHPKIAQAANGHCTKPNPLLQKQSKEFRIEKPHSDLRDGFVILAMPGSNHCD